MGDLNVDIPRAISDFADAMKEFELKEKLYRIIFRGKALEFEAYRDYVPDDDAKNIDWKATRRASKMLVKLYKEERDLDIFFVVDVSDNMVFGSTKKLKCEYAAELLAGFSHLIMGGNDKFGLILYSDKVVEVIEPSRGTNHFDRVVDTIMKGRNYGGSSNFESALDFILDYPKNIDALIFISDFLKIRPGVARNLIALEERSENLAVMVKDPLDLELPSVSEEVMIENPETGEQLLMNPAVAQGFYREKVKEKEYLAREIFKRANIDVASFRTDEHFAYPLAMFLIERVRRRGAFI